ncbi:DUF4157 domain-containing protein [Cellulophaga baltica]|uniref:eCIS core domain-containing protein n=1 Tax=Cellulophaga baltica TaxID=76594 RepID=UPI0021482C2A|nr:DUF4157 domain-containing protein [Cellulophaga baltica]MCR1024515.1 DUF4157 domain-containing protein [Cellulophaga baltica]
MNTAVSQYSDKDQSNNVSNMIVQASQQVSGVNDPLEHEADAMADHVMRMPANGLIQRKCSSCEEKDKAMRKPLASFIQKKGEQGGMMASQAVSNKIQSSKGRGKALPKQAKSFMESRFGTEFSDVNIHTGGEAIQMSQELNAKAFTVGNDIYFNSGQYAPNTLEGKRLLAHELTHTVQQGGKNNSQIQRRGVPARPPVRRPPIARPQARPTNGTVDSNPINTPVPYHQRYAPPPSHDNSFHAIRFRASVANARDQILYDLERPVATLERGGTSRNRFITLGNPRRHQYIAEGHGGNITYTPHHFHILDAIEHAIDIANTEREILLAIIENIPGYYSKLLHLNPRAGGLVTFPIGPIVSTFGFNIFPENLDPGGISRMTVLMSALVTKVQAQPELLRRSQILAALIEAEDFALEGRSRRQGACSFRNVSNRGGNQAHDIYASTVAADRGYGYQNDELEVQTPEGISYAFDAYNPNYRDVWEVKTKHEWTSDAGMPRAPFMPRFDERIVRMDFQRLRGLYVADRCGLRFKYAFDNCDVALGMRNQWNNIPPIEYIPFIGEPRVPCMRLD